MYMIEKKKARAKLHVPRKYNSNMHDPMTSRAQVHLTTRKKSVSPRWIRRDEYFCHVTQISLKANSSNFWYLDSGCSRHMTGNKNLFKTLVMKEGGCVAFGDGSKKRVVGDGGFSVLFSKDDYSILKPNGQTLLKCMRSNDNCYCLKARVVSCNMSKDEQIELWHERLGHMNFRDLRILDKFNVVRGLLKVGKKVNGVCGPC
ncbi:hypothetical protein LWI28_006603 [Acer negundo]|uniref:GAG-pre-integrase domain-containing protein n=1 Tax=Acer negundo TaxID=4023 RepID=A0AAD5NF36_ACENE|nr:hypothetical protein LWI28_006603 [Acer negundo]